MGGVGKTRLAVQVAAGAGGRVPRRGVAGRVGPGRRSRRRARRRGHRVGRHRRRPATVTDSIAQALSGRRLLMVLDNCEHVLDAAADLVETISRPHGDGEGDRHRRGRAAASGPSTVAGPVARRWAGPARRRWRCSSNGPRRSTRLRVGRPSADARRWSRSAGGWTGSRWRSSWRRRGWCR